MGELVYPGIENHILFFIIFNVVEDPGCVKPVEVVDEPLPDMEELHLADGELVPGDVLVNQPQLHNQGDDDGAVDRIPEMKSIIDNNSKLRES